MKLNEYGRVRLEDTKAELRAISKYSFKTIHFLATFHASDTDNFYAKDFNIDGGTMNALSKISLWIKNSTGHKHIVLPTGNTNKEMVNLYDNRYIEVEVKEWKINKELARDFMEFYKVATVFALGE